MSRAGKSTVAIKRLVHEYRNLTNDAPDGIIAGPKDETDYFLWIATFEGPEGTPFEGGIYEAELKFPDDYPLVPPKMRFLDTMFHPNGKFAVRNRGNHSRSSVLIKPAAKQFTPTAKSASPSSTPPATTPTTTSSPRSAGRPSRASRRSSSAL
jgi:ubiquitin-conjugating enzyme E2 G2